MRPNVINMKAKDIPEDTFVYIEDEIVLIHEIDIRLPT